MESKGSFIEEYKQLMKKYKFSLSVQLREDEWGRQDSVGFIEDIDGHKEFHKIDNYVLDWPRYIGMGR